MSIFWKTDITGIDYGFHVIKPKNKWFVEPAKTNKLSWQYCELLARMLKGANMDYTIDQPILHISFWSNLVIRMTRSNIPKQVIRIKIIPNNLISSPVINVKATWSHSASGHLNFYKLGWDYKIIARSNPFNKLEGMLITIYDPGMLHKPGVKHKIVDTLFQIIFNHELSKS